LISFVSLKLEKRHHANAHGHGHSHSHNSKIHRKTISSQSSVYAITFYCGQNYETTFSASIDASLLPTPTGTSIKGVVLTGIPTTSTSNCGIFTTETAKTFLSYRLLGNSTITPSSQNITTWIYNESLDQPIPIIMKFPTTTTDLILQGILININNNRITRQTSIYTKEQAALQNLGLINIYTLAPGVSQTSEIAALQTVLDTLNQLITNTTELADQMESAASIGSIKLDRVTTTITKKKTQLATANLKLTTAQAALAAVTVTTETAGWRDLENKYFKSLADLKTTIDPLLEESADYKPNLQLAFQYITQGDIAGFKTSVNTCLT